MSYTKNISLYQASNDLNDEQMQFIAMFSPEDQERFFTILTEEMNAHTNALNDETSKINQQNLEKEIAESNLTSAIAGIVVFCCLMFLFFVIFR
jgi:dsDNA-binding SOS-regulon protein